MVWIAVACLAGSARIAHAQRVTSSLDIGGASLRYADTVRATAATLAPALTARWPRASLGATGTISQLGHGSWTSQGRLNGSLWRPLAGPFSGDVAGSVGGSSHSDGARTSQVLGTLRLFASAGAGGAWAGGGAGSMFDGTTAHAVRQAEVGAWLSGAGRTAMVSATPTVVADSIRYTDMQGSYSAIGERAELALTFGARTGVSHLPTLGGAATSWGSAAAVVWLFPGAGVTIGGGTYPVDLTQGFPGGRFAALGLRFRRRLSDGNGQVAEPAPAGAAGTAGTAGAAAEARGAITDFRVQRSAGARRLIRVCAAAAATVELSGDFTQWQPVALANAGGGWWTVDVELSPGVHQVNVRVNGGAWLVPRGLAALTDEFGGVVGLLVVE